MLQLASRTGGTTGQQIGFKPLDSFAIIFAKVSNRFEIRRQTLHDPNLL